MRVSELMTRDVQTVRPTMPAAAAWELMRREHIRHLIVRSGGEIVGVLSDRDVAGPDRMSIHARSTVADLMTPQVVTVDPHATVRRAANLMRGRTIGCLPVVAGQRAVGIVTVSDLLGVLGKGVDRPSRPARRTLNHRVPHRKQKGEFGKW
jgi:CIC family chloride channel protein